MKSFKDCQSRGYITIEFYNSLLNKLKPLNPQDVEGVEFFLDKLARCKSYVQNVDVFSSGKKLVEEFVKTGEEDFLESLLIKYGGSYDIDFSYNRNLFSYIGQEFKEIYFAIDYDLCQPTLNRKSFGNLYPKMVLLYPSLSSEKSLQYRKNLYGYLFGLQGFTQEDVLNSFCTIISEELSDVADSRIRESLAPDGDAPSSEILYSRILNDTLHISELTHEQFTGVLVPLLDKTRPDNLFDSTDERVAEVVDFYFGDKKFEILRDSLEMTVQNLRSQYMEQICDLLKIDEIPVEIIEKELLPKWLEELFSSDRFKSLTHPLILLKRLKKFLPEGESLTVPEIVDVEGLYQRVIECLDNAISSYNYQRKNWEKPEGMTKTLERLNQGRLTVSFKDLGADSEKLIIATPRYNFVLETLELQDGFDKALLEFFEEKGNSWFLTQKEFPYQSDGKLLFGRLQKLKELGLSNYELNIYFDSMGIRLVNSRELQLILDSLTGEFSSLHDTTTVWLPKAFKNVSLYDYYCSMANSFTDFEKRRVEYELLRSFEEKVKVSYYDSESEIVPGDDEVPLTIFRVSADELK